MILPQKLQELQSQNEAHQREDSSSQQSNMQIKAKLDRTLEALQIAGSNAANARAEADASNARAESLSGQLNDLQSAIEETKRGMEVVRSEHDEVSRAARSIEGRLIRVEGELTRATRAKNDAVEARDILKSRAEKAEKLARELQNTVDDSHDEIRLLKKDLLELEELEKVRSDRTQRIESEFQEARAGLIEATSAAAEAESTVTSLRSVVEELRRENETLHEQLDANRDRNSKDRSKHNEALTQAEREAQKWKLKCEEADEESRKLINDKASGESSGEEVNSHPFCDDRLTYFVFFTNSSSVEKQVEQLKSRIAAMERRLNDSGKNFTRSEKTSVAASSSAVTPHSSADLNSSKDIDPSSANLGFINSFGAKDASVVSEESKKRKYVAELPRREEPSSKPAPNSSSRQLTYSFQQKENNFTVNQDQLQRNESFYGAGGGGQRKVARTNKCCLCSKEGGMLLSCQCDGVCCNKRAHALCVGKFRSGKKNDSKTILCGEA